MRLIRLVDTLARMQIALGILGIAPRLFTEVSNS